jgi:uncharacterized protein YgiM (DUF1202 family)
MDEGNQQPEGSYDPVRFARVVVPWVVLAAVTVAIWSVGADFVIAEKRASLAAKASQETSSTATTATAGVDATGTAYVAKVQKDVQLLAQPGSTSVVATARTGVTLAILESRTGWMRVKDSGGHQGWIPSNKGYVTLQAK